jgi:electron transfer flavoprotein beta subunit
MKILVPLKQIFNPAGITVNRKAGKAFVNREEYVMNPASKRALEAALRLKDSMGADVIVAAFGSAQAEDCLREARAMGADRAVHIPTNAIDSAGVVRALMALIEFLGGVDLVINGHRTLDTGLSSGASLAEALGWSYLGEAVECAVEGNVVHIIRRGDPSGRPPEGEGKPRPYEAFEADLPAVVTVTRGGPTPRYAHGGNIIATYRDPDAIETVTLDALSLSEDDLQTVTAERGQSFPPEREFGKQVTVEDIAAMIR